MDVHFVKRFPGVDEGRKGKCVYFERAPNSRSMKIYVTLEDPNLFSVTISEDEVDAKIRDIVSQGGGSFFVDNIETRGAIVSNPVTKPKSDCFFVVKDARGDELFEGTGGMVYFYKADQDVFEPAYRINENPYAQTGGGVSKWNEIQEKPPFGETTTEDGKRILTYDGRPVDGSIVTDPMW